MKTTIIVLGLFVAAAAGAQSDAKLKAIRGGREAVTKGRALASGLRSAESPTQAPAGGAGTDQRGTADRPMKKTPKTQ